MIAYRGLKLQKLFFKVYDPAPDNPALTLSSCIYYNGIWEMYRL